MMKGYQEWLLDHLNQAKVHYEELCKLDDQEQALGGTSEYYERAHQMFGYIAALEKCLREAHKASPPVLTKPKANSSVMKTKTQAKPKKKKSAKK